MNILILGHGCKNCAALEQRARGAVESLGLSAEFGKVTDDPGIASYGILSTPGLVIDGEVVLSGRVPTERELVEIIGARAGA